MNNLDYDESITLSLESKISSDLPSLCLQLDLEKLFLIEHVDAARHKGEISHNGSNHEFADQRSLWIPYVDSIATARVDISLRVGVYAIGSRSIGVSEDLSIANVFSVRTNVITADCSGVGYVDLARECRNACVGDV